MLKPYRVLDLTDERGLLCGQILADLGADVIAVEPPGGNRARRVGPFAGNHDRDPERSLTWWAYARGKRSLVLDLETETDRTELLRLARDADILVESETPGRMTELGLDYDTLSASHPHLIYVSITAWGQDGPKARLPASDLVVGAAGCMLFGDPDRAPVRICMPQAFLHAGADAAGAALIALRERQRSGCGQHVDVSAQQAVAQATQSFILAAAIGDRDPVRLRGGVKLGPVVVPQVWHVKDGYVCLTVFFGAGFGPFTRRLMEWVCEEGFCDEATRDKNWIGYLELLMSGGEPATEYERVLDCVRAFMATKTKAELVRAALDRRLLIAPFANLDELVSSPQLASRDYWRAVETVDGRRVLFPGPFAHSDRAPITYRRRAPRIGEHDEEIRAQPRRAKLAHGCGSEERPAARQAPLTELKVLDLMWVMAGPAATRVMSDYGATVVRVESSQRLDTARTFPPFHGGIPGPDSSALYLNMNVGKLGVTLDLDRPEGREVVLDLVRWADVVGESFSPRAMRAWGLDYDSLRQVKPDLVMLSSALFGQTGPHALLAGFGNMAAAISGFNSLVGWPDRDPSLTGAYSDYVSPRFTLAVLLAALDHRDRTGEGQYIDFSQVEAALHFLTPALLDYTANGRVWQRMGNLDLHHAPHGLYPTIGDDRWLAIAVETDEQWQHLCGLMARPDLAMDERFCSAPGRLLAATELDEAVTAWTSEQDRDEAERRLQDAGVPAQAALGSDEARREPQFRHRHHFVELPHPVHGTTTIEGSRFRLSETPARIERAAPTLGRDNRLVLHDILGYDEHRIADLVRAGVLQ